MSAHDSTLDRLLRLAGEQAEAGQGLRLLDRKENATFFEWSTIARQADRVGRQLTALGVRRGDRIALVFPTSIDFIHAFFGALAAGAVPAPLYPPIRLGRIEEYHGRTARMIGSAGARLVLADPRILKVLGETIEGARPELGCRTLGELPEPGAEAAAPGRLEELALIQFSSGTTVDPKPVALSHRAVVAQARALNAFWPDHEAFDDTPRVNDDEPVRLRHSGVSWLPLYHDMGLIGCIFTALERQATITLIPPEAFVVRPAIWLRTLSRYRATVSPAPNFAYGLAVEKIRDDELEGVDLSEWRVALNGAEAVAPSVLRAFTDRFVRWGFRPKALTPVYGLSEASLAVTFSAIDRPFRSVRFDRESLVRDRRAVPGVSGREIVSVGRPLPGFEIEIRGDDGAPAPSGRIGRIWARGPSLMDGYLDQPEATASALVDGWLDTGDLGFLHDDQLFLTGRAKDLLILRGRNYSPEGIEQAIEGVPGTRRGCSVAVGHLPERGQREELWLFVERARRSGSGAIAGTQPNDDDLAADCRRAVLAATELTADEVILVPAGTLPRTSSGKLRRGETLRLFLAGELKPPKRVGRLGMLRLVYRSSRALRRSEKRRRRAGDRAP